MALNGVQATANAVPWPAYAPHYFNHFSTISSGLCPVLGDFA